MSPTPSACRRILAREFEQRLSLNPAYSKRAFARQLGLAPSFVSHLFNGNRRLTPQTAQTLSEKLSLSTLDREALMTEALGLKSASKSETRVLQTQLPVELFRPICNWWHVAILEYLESSARDHSPEAIARKFGIPRASAALALEKLVELKFVRKDPKKPRRFVKTNASQRFASNAPNDALRAFHGQLLDRAKEAIHTQPNDRKVVGTMTIAVDPKDLAEIRKRWLEFRKSIEGLASQGKNRDSVYTMIFEFFDLGQPS